uniref:Uncharacterized protein n=1 Tax=Anguilla anguilla TaxID=7936 RepID=A0A0E9TLE3_ANGAN
MPMDHQSLACMNQDKYCNQQYLPMTTLTMHKRMSQALLSAATLPKHSK